MKTISTIALCFLLFTSCKKDPGTKGEGCVAEGEKSEMASKERPTTASRIISSYPASVPAGIFTTYTIPAGQHFSDKNVKRALYLNSMPFVARFNTSAVYVTSNPANQNDINMLYGFSEGPITNYIVQELAGTSF